MKNLECDQRWNWSKREYIVVSKWFCYIFLHCVSKNLESYHYKKKNRINLNCEEENKFLLSAFQNAHVLKKKKS